MDKRPNYTLLKRTKKKKNSLVNTGDGSQYFYLLRKCKSKLHLRFQLILFVMAIIKLRKLKKSKDGEDMEESDLCVKH